MAESNAPVRVSDVAERISKELNANDDIVEVARELDGMTNDQSIPEPVRKRLNLLTDKLLDASLTIVSSASANATSLSTLVKSGNG
jgi:hypothetical protein